MLRALVLFLVVGKVLGALWWQTEVMYQVYPRSFQDSNGDGTGDLKGITERLPYLKSLGVGFIWLSPVMQSPMLDFGYDIENFMLVDPLFGTMEDMKELIAKAKLLGIRILMDFVPNHSSNYSAWFNASRSSKTDPKRDWYIWHPGKVLSNGTRVPPNNWASNFGGGLGSSWTWDPQTEEYYYHAFGEFQPDLNYHNPEVVKAMQDVLRFWLQMGIGGFRIDAVPFLLEDPQLKDEPYNATCAETQPVWNCMQHIHTQNDPKNHDIIHGWRTTIDEFEERVMFGEIYAALPDVMTYYGTKEKPEFNVPFNFAVIGENYGQPNDLRKASVARDAIRDYAAALPKGAHGNWVLGNHDNHRLMDRLNNNTDLAATIYALLNCLPGTPTVYNGDEIGMNDLYIPYEKCQDPMCLKNPKLFATTGRDPERTPMQWSDGPQAGFSTNKTTWLPINPNYVSTNVEKEAADNSSPLSVMKRTLKFRAATPQLALGRIEHVLFPGASLDDHLVAVTSKLSNNKTAVTVANWDTSASHEVDLASHVFPSNWKKVFTTLASSTADMSNADFEMKPYEVAVFITEDIDDHAFVV